MEPHQMNPRLPTVFAPPGTSTRSYTVLATLAPCSTTARRFSPSLHEASRNCRNRSTSPIHAMSCICSLARCKFISSQIAKPFRVSIQGVVIYIGVAAIVLQASPSPTEGLYARFVIIGNADYAMRPCWVLLVLRRWNANSWKQYPMRFFKGKATE